MLNRKEKTFFSPWILFGIYLIGYFSISMLIKDQSLFWLWLDIFSLTVSVIMLIKHHFSGKSGIILSTVITAIYLLSNVYRFNFFSLIQATVLFLAAAASCSVFEDYITESLKWIRCKKKTDILISILIGIGVGLVWGGINYLLMKSSNSIVKPDALKAFIFALNPATMEEVALRTVFYAFCLHCAGGKLISKKRKFTVWFLMIIPHILPHLMFSLSEGLNGVIMWLIYLVLYIVIFGFIFAFLQQKRDIASAMIAHGIVDFIRFLIFGLPG